MDLKIKDVAELLDIPETTIRRWASERKIPAYRLRNHYRFNRTEIEDWVMKHKLTTQEKEEEQGKPQISFPQQCAKGNKQYSLYRSLHNGEIFHDIYGSDKEEVIRKSMKLLAQQLSLDAEVITDLLLDRERLMPTSLNNGIAVPHTRDFLLNQYSDVVAVVFLEKPIPYGALDGKPVHTLFFLFACEDKRHLHLLAKIAHLSNSPETLSLLLQKPQKKQLLDYIKQWESCLSSTAHG